MVENRNRLTKVLGRTDIIALGFGTMVGWSWIVIAASWVTEAGFFGTIIAFLLGSFLIILVSLTYGELTAALPLSGGEFIYAYRAGGEKFAWIVGWFTALAYLGVAAWEGIALATAVNYLFPIPSSIYLWEIAGYQVYLSWPIVGMIGGGIMLALNIFGTKPAIIFQVMATAGILGMGIMILLGGITFGNISNIGIPFTSTQGFFYVLLIIPSMLIGFDVIPQFAEEMNIPPKNIGRMIVVCVVISCFWYIFMIIGVGLSAPAEIRMSGELPLADIISYAYGEKTFGTVLVVVGILGILTSWNGFFMGASRLLFAMGRAKMLPSVFGRLSKKRKTPWAAILVVGTICILSPLLGKNALIWFINISSSCALFAYCCVVFSFLVLRKKEPNLNRPIKSKLGFKGGSITLVFVSAYLLIYVYMGFRGESYFYELVGILLWLLIGIVLYIYSRFKYGKVIKEEREVLIFGSKLARYVKKDK